MILPVAIKLIELSLREQSTEVGIKRHVGLKQQPTAMDSVDLLQLNYGGVPWLCGVVMHWLRLTFSKSLQ